MKLGISYPIWDSEELLEGSIRCIRNQVDYISVVYQEISNFGNRCSDNLFDVLYKLKAKGYIDDLYKYNPIADYKLNGEVNLVVKRSIGLDLARDNGCTHYMTMDADEFYDENQFAYMKKTIEEGGYDAGACHHVQYYKDSKYMLANKEQEYVSTIYEIKKDTRWAFYNPCPIAIDPMRKATNSNYYVFNRGEVEMHHMSFVRKDLAVKFANHSCRMDFLDSIDKMVDYYNKWEYPMPAMWAGGVMQEVVEVERKFDVYSEEQND